MRDLPDFVQGKETRMIKIKEREPIKLSGLTSFTVEFPFNQQILNAVKGIPGAIWHKKLVC